MLDKEFIIVTLTSWKPRIPNLPVVLDTIFQQTLPPDKVVLNLAYDEVLPDTIYEYLMSHEVEVYRVPDTKVYKKLIPTLRRYPEACVIVIDDDFYYPKNMIRELIDIHKRYPEFPISGNRIVYRGIQCHCGCASLTKASYFGEYIDQIDDNLIYNCGSDDIVYSFLSTKAGHPYIRTNHEYFINMKTYNEVDSYSVNYGQSVENTYDYLENRFGKIDTILKYYIHDSTFETIILDMIEEVRISSGDFVRNSLSYKIGHTVVKPYTFIKRLFGQLL